jgi:lipoate---protein ligase
MRAQLHLLALNQCSILKQLQIEEALLRADKRNWCILNQNASDAIVMGISGKIEQHIDQTLLKKQPIPIIRRFSGGGTVIVDENTLFATFICQADVLEIPCCPKKIMNWTGQLYQPLFGDLPFALRENDYAIGWHKVGGNAQYLSKNRWLHHSSFLWDFDPAKMHYLLMPPKTPAYREQRTHSDFLCCLKEHWEDKTSFIDQLKKAIQRHFEIVLVGLNEVEKLLLLPHRKATTVIN